MTFRGIIPPLCTPFDDRLCRRHSSRAAGDRLPDRPAFTAVSSSIIQHAAFLPD